MRKILRKVSFYALGALLALSCAVVFALSAKTARADNTVNVNKTVISASDTNAGWSFTDNFSSGSLTPVQAGENGVTFSLTFNNSNVSHGGNMYRYFDILIGPTNNGDNGAAVHWGGAVTKSGQLSIRFMVNYDDNTNCRIYAAPLDAAGTGLYSGYDWGAVGQCASGGSINFTLSLSNSGSGFNMTLNTLNLTGYLTARGGSAFMNSAYKTNIAFQQLSGLLGGLNLNSYTAISTGSGGGTGGGGGGTTTGDLPAGAAGGVVYGSGTTRWSYVDAIGGGTTRFQAAEYGVQYTFAIKDTTTVTGYNSFELGFGPDNTVPGIGQSTSAGHFVLGIMVNENGNLYAIYYDNTGTERFGASETTRFGTHNASSYTNFTVAFHKVNNVWTIELNGNTVDSTLFNQYTGGAFMDANFYTNVAITNANVTANVALMNAQGLTDGGSGGGGEGGGGETPVNPDLPAGAIGGIMGQQSWNYKTAKESYMALQQDGIEFKIGVALRKSITNGQYPGFNVYFGSNNNPKSSPSFSLGFMLNGDNQYLYLTLSGTSSQLIGASESTKICTLAVGTYVEVKVSVQHDENGWLIFVNDRQIGTTEFAQNIGSAWMNGSYQTNMVIDSDNDYPNVALYSFKGLKLTASAGKYLVKFMVGDNIVATEEVSPGGKVSKPANPTHETATDLVFDGWYYNGNEWNFNSNTVSGNMSLKARFKTVDIQEVEIDDGTDEPTTPTNPDNPGGGPSIETDDGGSGCGGGIVVELPLLAVLLSVAGAVVVLVKKSRKA